MRPPTALGTPDPRDPFGPGKPSSSWISSGSTRRRSGTFRNRSPRSPSPRSTIRLGWDYLGAVSGALPREADEACAAWLEAQLAADATRLGRRFRPTVELVPAGRLWYVVRSVGEFICVVDGPGFPSPLTAAIAASRRYQAELRRDHDPDKGRAVDPTPAVDTDAPVEATLEAVWTDTVDRSPADAEGR